MNPEQAFVREVNFALHHLFYWIHTNGREDVFQNIPERIPGCWQEKFLADKLYSIYAFDYRFINHVTNAVEQQLTVSIEGEFAAFKQNLQRVAELVNGYAKQGMCAELQSSKDGGWFFSGPVGSETIAAENSRFRIYINVRSEYIADFVSLLVKELQRTLRGLPFRYKFASYWNVDALDLMRPEKIVLYLPEGTDYKPFLSFLSTKTNYFLDESPMFAKRYCKGVAIAPHITEDMKGYLGIPTNSFGDAVCHIIARSLLSWVKRFRRLPTPEDFDQIGDSVYKIVIAQAYVGER